MYHHPNYYFGHPMPGFVNLAVNMDKAQLTKGSDNVFACKNGKTFLDKNNVNRLVRDVGANMDYTNCSLGSEAKIEYKVVDGTQQQFGDIHAKGGKVDFSNFNKQMAGFNQNVNAILDTNQKR